MKSGKIEKKMTTTQKQKKGIVNVKDNNRNDTIQRQNQNKGKKTSTKDTKLKVKPKLQTGNSRVSSKTKTKIKRKRKSKDKIKKSQNEKHIEPFQALPIVCDIDTLRTLIRKKQVRVVDVRRNEDYQNEHIKSAVSLPLAKIIESDTPQAIVEILEKIGVSDDMPVVVYDDTFGALAARVAWTFQYVGHTNTALLETTFSNWKKMGLETENKVNTFPETKHSLNLNEQIHADAQYVESAKENPGKIVIDSRERLNFLTEHIPGARNIPYTMLGSDGNILRDPSELKRFIENRGIPADSEVITYCGSVGTLSGLAYYALKLAGVKDVKLYSKSFKEWKSLGKPKEEFKEANYWDLSAE